MRLTSNSFKLACVVFSASLISACGFHLRGDYSVPEELSTISVTSYDEYSTFTRVVKNQFRLNDVEIVLPNEEIPNMHLLGEGVGERTLSLYQNTRAAEIELTFRASYRVTIPELGAKTFSTSVTRSYLDNPLTALAKSVERDMIEDEMRKLASTQIIRQMGRLRADIEAHEMLLEEQFVAGYDNTEEQYKIKTIEGQLPQISNPQAEANSTAADTAQ
ncbi:LPS assembly lipoprotein LptE [Vibrio genomosp. F10]|uniref:LPS-assembly lipoprotein LptE n=2 Tax=Vibrio genomosp. F10 TaxID=723171 RepID=A0A1B9QZF7_9VIBR|nr:LPS assembly lipoprotein LptE [Vibrio genomosp. F10]OCH75923.1 luciferase [Vibrio genomosp. F10]OEE34205.1 luciferase [Vibrio genomosp. F10 str. ZF-129]OEE97469.1 luciferase [Vibrio genomosp. F10 str. 9ZC157]OEF01003.1 luciferase [Vibrio genomosp. F10 str. 9ZD137]OEF07402.1 luciferase [Vibrio genomosp. F10 str. 9ZB36]